MIVVVLYDRSIIQIWLDHVRWEQGPLLYVVHTCSYFLMLSLFTGLHGSAEKGFCKGRRLFVWQKPYALCSPMTETVQLNLATVFCVVLPEIGRPNMIVINVKPSRLSFESAGLALCRESQCIWDWSGGVWWFAVLGDRPGSYHVLSLLNIPYWVHALRRIGC